MIRLVEYNYLKCWETMNCPDEIRKNCWAYRLNLGLECWLLRKKARKSPIRSSWQNQRKCSNC